MKQLFLKSNLLHIRLKEGIFEVVDYRCAKLKELPCAGEGVEWPYEVELIKQYRHKGSSVWKIHEWDSVPENDEFQYRTVARLLPKEEKKEPQENIFDLPKDVVFDLQRIALADDEMSAGFGAGVEYRLIARSILNKHRKPVSAPSESQEEHAKLFAEWLRKNNWSAIPKSEQHWFNILSGEKLRTTNDLYSDFTRNP